MRKYIRDQLIELLPTIWEGVKYAKNKQSEQATVILSDCYFAVNSIADSLEAGLSENRFAFYENYLSGMKNMLEAINEGISSNQPISEFVKQFRYMLGLLKKELIKESEVKLEVVFMPYKASMWDSLESIWLAARNDESCDPIVVPIPYYDRNPDRSFGEFHYEGGEYPDYVPIVHYDNYDLSNSKPDVIYIHNPYDEHNLVTSVDPRFYSYNLKRFTNMLVYVPYFISGAYLNTQVFAQKHLTSCVNEVDKIIVQSYTHKKIYVECGVNENKLLVMGSPKMDSIVNLNKNNENIPIPITWIQKLNRKKAIVLNSSIGSLLNDPNYFIKLKHRMSIILSYNELVLIWRPHPLLETTIVTMRPDFYDAYMEIIHMIENSSNGILDQSASTVPATIVSAGMISDLSSWARQYIATGKPILMLNGKKEMKKDRICVFDHFSSYFIYDGFSIQDFCNMIIDEKDINKESRLTDLRNSVVNIDDGSCGQKVHKRIVSL
ncbi:CDP-glycerol glycerophosphotransferase family protein [Paenibacillus sp. SN-8-1]|uniref:CDP-glycerol glycerophosphotransferase family protein n=1 Tax=Paenibacillus sp. SN-8-1 TaxID=3435409 RepID=UPI003D9A2F71